MPNGYQPIEFGGEDYFSKQAEYLNEAIDKEMKKAMKKIAQQSVSQFGLVPGGASVMGDIMGDIQTGGLKAKERGYTDIALGAALPQYQADVNWQTLLQQQKFTGEQSELDRQLKEDLTKWMMEYQTAQAGEKPKWWQSLLSGLAPGVGYFAGEKIYDWLKGG